jgi:hypothetical protein
LTRWTSSPTVAADSIEHVTAMKAVKFVLKGGRAVPLAD